MAAFLPNYIFLKTEKKICEKVLDGKKGGETSYSTHASKVPSSHLAY